MWTDHMDLLSPYKARAFSRRVKSRSHPTHHFAMGTRKILILGTIIIFASGSFADPNDFVNPKYVVAAKNDEKTRNARDRIVRDAKSSARKGPWTITNSQVRASSGDPRDYLSWAPYHWPNCNWCGKPKATTNGPSGPDTQEQQVRSQSDSSEGQSSNDLFNAPGPNNGSTSLFERLKRQVDYNDPFHVAPNYSLGLGLLDMMGDIFDLFLGVEKQELATSEVTPTRVLEGLESIKGEVDKFTESLPADHGSSASPESSTGTSTIEPKSTEIGEHRHTYRPAVRDLAPLENTGPNPALAISASLVHTSMVAPPAPLGSTTSSTASPSDLEESPLRAPKPTKTKTCKAWSSCLYKTRDGKVNPDTRDIKSSAYIGQMSQSALWNAIAAVASGSKPHEKSVAEFINTFFLDNKNKMNPKLEFGQVVRGPPGTQAGSYMGILDMRSLVKVVNAILVLRETQSPYWTQDRDDKMKAWATQYVQWVETSPVGQKAERAANNHGSFYPNQIAALKILSGDIASAKQALQSYFDNQFQDQIVASGEQASLTRYSLWNVMDAHATIKATRSGSFKTVPL
ncbi:unnamed protein product [Rhizoctonia solani]|uniref:Alginate lyase domain-containing protein n=1 Tax=Rhizoctonia solani TaxID=456999 RepID=A0A8H2XMJ4_9AGAM|nr:unnamed protein product [Rhizoctonia solani]